MEEVPLFKLILIGDDCVGKSCLLKRYGAGVYEDSISATIGVDFKVRTISIDENKVKLQIWDTVGQKKFRNITKSYLTMASGILLVFDLHNRDTFNSIQTWINWINDSSKSSMDVVLVGNKSDLPLAVSHDEIRELSEKNNIPFFLTSAKYNSQVDIPFEYIARILLKRRMDSSPTPSKEKEPKEGECRV